MTGVIPDKAAVLAAINDLRAGLDLAPLDAIPCGLPKLSGDCPVAKALSRPGKQARVGDACWRTMYGQPTQPLPLVLYQFICAFDKGAYPDLIEGRAA